MNTLIAIGLILALVAVALAPLAAGKIQRNGLTWANNIAEGTHEGVLKCKAAAAITLDGLMLKETANAGEVDICGAADLPLGIGLDQAAAAGDRLSVGLLGVSKRTLLGVASENLAAKTDVFTAADGKLQNEPAVAGTYWLVGRTVKAAAANALVEFEPRQPVKLVVIAALTSTDGTAAAAADLAALKVEAEKIGDDVRAIAAALATPTLVKVLAA